MAFSDSLVIQSVYLAIGPLCIVEPSSTKRSKGREVNPAAKEAGLSVLMSLRMEALGCLRGVSSRSLIR